LIELDFVVTKLRMVTGNAVYRAIVLGDDKCSILLLLTLTHVAHLGEDSRQFNDLFGAGFASQPWGYVAGEVLAASFQYTLDGIIAVLLRNVVQNIKRKAIIVFWEIAFGFGGEGIEVARATHAAAEVGHFNETVTFKQG
jgi:hypothetical protein